LDGGNVTRREERNKGREREREGEGERKMNINILMALSLNLKLLFKQSISGERFSLCVAIMESFG